MATTVNATGRVMQQSLPGLKDLLSGLVSFPGQVDMPITGITLDSREVIDGDIFIALSGSKQHGLAHVEQAVNNGACAVVFDPAGNGRQLAESFQRNSAAAVPMIAVENLALKLGDLAARFYRDPSRSMNVIGITGTNGKTTTAFLTEALLNFASRKAVLIGTIEYHVAGEVRPSLHTTPESRDVFELLAEGAGRGATELITEVSSHGLDQGRNFGIPFDVAVFTNLTRDHLDYHVSMEKYFAAKRLLFDGAVYPAPRVAVLNAHDERTPDLIEVARNAGSSICTYGIGIGDFRAASHKLTPGGATIHLETPAGTATIASRLAGDVNVLNLLAAFTAAHARGVAFNELAAAVPHLTPVPGRFQPVDAGQPFTVIVDYA
ncbi:MAG: Mur ligase family protein, partial [Methylobacter sp.]